MFSSLEILEMKKVYLVLLLMLTLSACVRGSLAADTLPWVNEDPILFKDSFATETGGWITHEDAMSFSGYAQGGFRMWANVPNFQFWSLPSLNFKNTHIFVKTTKLSGPDDNLIGLICRYQDESNFYALMIGSDGYYGIFRTLAGEQMLIDQPHMEFSEAINRGKSVNEIQAVCKDDHLILIVNDVKLLQVQDDSFETGDVGLIVGNFSEQGVDILFDNFIVVRP